MSDELTQIERKTEVYDKIRPMSGGLPMIIDLNDGFSAILDHDLIILR